MGRRPTRVRRTATPNGHSSQCACSARRTTTHAAASWVCAATGKKSPQDKDVNNVDSTSITAGDAVLLRPCLPEPHLTQCTAARAFRASRAPPTSLAAVRACCRARYLLDVYGNPAPLAEHEVSFALDDP